MVAIGRVASQPIWSITGALGLHMKLVPMTPTQQQQAMRLQLIDRLMLCLADADSLPIGRNGSIEISMAIHKLGGEVPLPPI
jgi:hypothetical protein